MSVYEQASREKLDDARLATLRDNALAAAHRCISNVVEGDPASAGEFPAADRKANAQAALALVQTARTLEPGRRT